MTLKWLQATVLQNGWSVEKYVCSSSRKIIGYKAENMFTAQINEKYFRRIPLNLSFRILKGILTGTTEDVQ